MTGPSASPPPVTRAEKPLLNPRLVRIREALACPSCHGELVLEEGGLRCGTCVRLYAVRGGRIYFIEPLRSDGALDRLKEIVKRYTGNFLYRIVFPIVNPTFPFSYRKQVVRHSRPEEQIIVDVGSGNHRLHEDIIAIDGIDYPSVDIVADVTALPFKDESVDVFASRSVLEHLHPLGAALAEMKRATVPGGMGLHLVPFLYPFHSSVGDYQRLTHMGAAHLMEDWRVVEQRHVTGPFTLLLVVMIEVLAITLSFGNGRVKAVLYLLFCILLFPIKFLDLPFLWRREYITVAPTIWTVLQKPH